MGDRENTRHQSHAPQPDDQRHSKTAAEQRVEQRSVLSYLSDFGDYSSAHGVGRIRSSKRLVGKVLWSLLFVGAVGMLLFQVHLLSKKFQERPLNTFIRLEHETSLPFPTVTICNFNSIRNSMERNLSALLSPQFMEIPEYPEEELDDWEDWEGSGFFDDDEYLDDPSQATRQFAKQQKILAGLAVVPSETLVKLGHQFEDIVLSCEYRGISCSNYTTRFWASYWHYSYGNCFVFNGGKNLLERNKSILRSNKAGPSNGLNLVLNIEMKEYVGNFTEAGIRVAISDAGEMPFPLENGLSAAPGFSTSVGLVKTLIKRRDPFANGRCLQASKLEEEGNLYYRAFGASYSAVACKESCLGYNQRKTCGCMEYRFPSPYPHICDFFNKTEVRCLMGVQKKFKENKLNCSHACHAPCEQNVFKRSVSVASWPNQRTGGNPEDSCKNQSAAFDGTLKLQIFYEDLNYEVIEEIPAYEFVNFVSDIGGQLGLWIGFSVLTVAEFLELMLLVCGEAAKRCTSTRKTTDVASNT